MRLGSGWISALVQANIASTGTTNSFINVSHVTKTRHAHQATAASLHILLHCAYTVSTSLKKLVVFLWISGVNPEVKRISIFTTG